MTSSGHSHVTIIYFPHATSLDNEAGISTGQADVQLSQLGYSQIQKLKKATMGQKFDAVFSSDLSRALQTAQGAFGDSNRIIADPRLREINIGKFTGYKDSFTHPLTSKYIDQPFPGGESFEDVEKRIMGFLDDLARNYLGKKVAVVGHMAPQLALDVIIKHLSWREAIDHDWRKNHAFQYGWEYTLVMR